MSTRFFHLEKRGFLMIGSIFQVCYPFQGISGAKETIIRRHGWKWAAGGVLAVVLGARLLRTGLSAEAFDWSLAVAAVTHLRWPWLLVALVPIFGTYYGRALRWEVFLKPQKARPSMRNLLVATIIGFTAITLFGRAGDFVRPYLIAVKEQVPVTSQIASWFLERVFDLLLASLLLGFALSRVQTSRLHVGAKLAWVLASGGKIVGVSCALVLVALFVLRQFAEPVRCKLVSATRWLPKRWAPKVEKLVSALVKGVESIRSDGALVLIVLYSILEWLLIAACYWCLAQAFVGIINITLVDVLILMAFISFGGVVQIPGIGGGTQVVAILVLTELYGTRVELATSFALLLWILTFVAIVPVGLGLAVKEGLDWHSLRQIGREATE
jgi:glycosyltransferase 2 family protein